VPVLPADFLGTGRTGFVRWSDNPAENQLWASDALARTGRS
jgi:hypothetical protein